jgi:hypothetical protein
VKSLNASTLATVFDTLACNCKQQRKQDATQRDNDDKMQQTAMMVILPCEWQKQLDGAAKE